VIIFLLETLISLRVVQKGYTRPLKGKGLLMRFNCCLIDIKRKRIVKRRYLQKTRCRHEKLGEDKEFNAHLMG